MRIFDIKLFLLLLTSILFSQEIPQNLFIYNKNKFLLDCGKNWDINSIYGPYRFQQLNINHNDIINSNDSIYHNMTFGINVNPDVEVFGFIKLNHKNFYSFLYPRLVTNSQNFERYTGISRDIKRLGFNSGETDFSGFGYENENILFQISRGRESWGAGDNIQLAISNNSPSYDYIKFRYKQNKFRFNYFHGFLENINNYNRYITGRGLEITNRKSLLIGLSEIVIYSGLNRPLDFAYLNPVANHLEIELNDRQNLLGVNDANAVWQISYDHLIRDQIRLSGNILFDEFVFDKAQQDSGKANGLGMSTRIAFNKNIKKMSLVFYSDITIIGTHTFRHARGYNNFVQRNKPLGWENGSDGYEYKIGLNYYNNNDIIIRTGLGKRQLGSSSITNDSYEKYYYDYKDVPFPSGEISDILFFDFYFQWNYSSNTNISLISNYQNINSDKSEFYTRVCLYKNFIK